MTTTVIPNSLPYGVMTNQAISRLLSLQGGLERLNDAITTASAGYTGVAGTEFEATPSNTAGVPFVSSTNLFGITPSETPGEQGSAYKYAMSRIHEEWVKFWAVAEPFVNQLDNGQPLG